MSEVLQRIFNDLPQDQLDKELARVEVELERLTERREMINKALGRIANVEQLSLGT